MGGVEAITERSVTTLGNDCLVAWLYQVWGEIDHTYAISSGRGDRNLTQTIATVGAVTATASFRFAKWFDGWFTISRCNVIIGKAGMTGETYKRHFVPNNAIYLTTVGYGTGALLGRGIKRVVATHWVEEMGLAQALWVLEVENFGPFLVESDLAGASLFERENAKIAPNIAKLYAGTKPTTMRRYGETDDKTEDVIGSGDAE
jgi:L(+)-tartrate dehydratase beta subunit